MECEVDGVPQRDGMVKWLRDDHVLEDVSFIGQTRAVMRLNASLATSGAYTCLADNGIGTANHTLAYLLVNRAPAISRQPSMLRAAGPLGGQAHLRCRAHAVPDARFQWIIQGHSSPLRHNNSKYAFTTSQLDYTTFEVPLKIKGSLYISSLDRYDYQYPVKCRAVNVYGDDAVEIRVSQPTAPDTPLALRVSNITKNSLSFHWIPGFDGGSEQTFEVRYQTPSESVYHVINSSSQNVEIRGLQPAQLYEVAIRALNKRGLASEFSRPPITVYTKDEYGMDVVSSEKRDPFSTPIVLLFGMCCIALLLVNCILLCYMHQRKKRRKKMQEKTEMVRKSSGGGTDVQPVQMYGALTNVESPCRPGSMNTNRSELGREQNSEDDQSVRTMIEVSPNGCVQPAEPANYYEKDCIIEYDFDPNLYSDVIKSSTLRRGLHNYANVRYPDVPCHKVSDGGTLMSCPDGGGGPLSRGTDVSAMDSPRRIHKPRIIDDRSPTSVHANSNNNNNTVGPQMLSTFVQQGAVHTTPLNFAHIDGDLV
ncbi:unnamed protein product [Gongylonema pulchrum]|uniref:Nephrin n=1 Tax=Gongylonema pulchrum TaxID=637853 RepID=A0A183CVS8_9BILA|nr:unnamed protein product [Gongylonema pulchrum]